MSIYMSRRIVFWIAAMATACTPGVFAQGPAASSSDANIHLRGQFHNARIRFEREKKGHVAFIGGSANNDNAAALFGTLALLGGMLIYRDNHAIH